MKTLLLLALAFASFSAFARPEPETIKAVLEAQPACAKFVRFDDRNIYLGFGTYRNSLEEPRLPIPGKFRVAPLSGAEPFELRTKDAAIDIAVDGATAFVLTYSSIEEWDLEKRERVATHPTYMIQGPLAYKEHAQAMARYEDKLVIAHGRLGVSIFNLKTKRLVNQFRLLKRQLPLESMATGVAVQGNIAYLALSNFHLTRPGDTVDIFRGIVTMNMDSETVLSELGGMDPGADALVADAKKIIVSFGGMPIWKYGIETLKGKAIPEPENRVWRFPLQGHPTGAPAMDAKYYYTCFSSPGEGGYFENKPLALDRRVLMLD